MSDIVTRENELNELVDKIKKGFSLDLFQTCDEIGDLRNGDLPLLDTLEKDQIVGERYEKERDTFFDETSAHLCEYLNLNLADNEDPFVKLSQEADAQRDEMEASRKRVLDKRQAYKDLEKSYNELKQTYRDLVEEKSNFDKHEVNQNSKLFTKMSTILNATYKTNSEGKAIAVNLQNNDVLRRVSIEDPEKSLEEKIKEFWKVVKSLASKI